MNSRQFTGNPCQTIVEQLVAGGVRYVFNNPGSREALFFDALHSNPDIHGIVSLHEGSVTATAGGYAQSTKGAAVMTVHLGAGLAQCLGQLINVWGGSLPVVIITFVGDTGSRGDYVELDVTHNVGPTAISAPFTKANWTVLEAEGLAQAVERALRVATTPPVGPVHLAVYDRLLGQQQLTSTITEGPFPNMRAGVASDDDLLQAAQYLQAAKRPLICVGDGVWKSGAGAAAAALAENSGALVAGDMRSVSVKHPLHTGRRVDAVIQEWQPDCIAFIGSRPTKVWSANHYQAYGGAQTKFAIGSGIDHLKNVPGMDLAILADELRTVERLNELLEGELAPPDIEGRQARAREAGANLRSARRRGAQRRGPEQDKVRGWVLADALDAAMEKQGGGLITLEQFAVPVEILGGEDGPGNNEYISPAGGSEGYGAGAAVGAKLGAPNKPVAGLVGDGSLYYSDSAIWTAAHHSIPVLYVISNNESYGIVANSFEQSGGEMSRNGDYNFVALQGMDPAAIANAFGVEGRRVTDEASVEAVISESLDTVEKEGRPMLLDVRMPLGLPEGSSVAPQFRMASR
jgi:benzoylformate decarboxylase